MAELAAQPDRWLIVGIGNPDRGDDAVGRVVARLLRAHASRRLEVQEHDGEAIGLLARIEGAEAVCLVDAARSGAPPGTIKRFDVVDAELPAPLLGLSTHGYGLGEAIELARALGQLPQRCVIYAVEGRSFEAGVPLSVDAIKAASEVVERILLETRETEMSRT